MLQSRDASLVASQDPAELERVRDSFLKKKLSLTASDSDLDNAIHAISEQMKDEVNKSRVTFYYLLAEKYGKLSMFIITCVQSNKNPKQTVSRIRRRIRA